MSISDFIVILSIIVTLVTVAVSNNKHLWLYKFDKKISTVLIIVAILIHYLIFFNKYFYHRGWYLKCFMYQNGIETNIWAYIVTIITLSVLIYYITKCRYFPKSNNDKIIRYYKSLINTNIAGLISNIDTYHKKDIDKYFEFVNKLPKENSKKDSNELIDEEQVNNKVKANLPRDIVHNILFNKNFIKHSLDIDPIYFLDKVYNVTSDCLINFSEVISFYFNYLIESKNTEFISELETISDDIIKNDKRFLPLIFNEKPNFISTVALDKVFGETAYKEICICNYIFNQKINEWFDNEYKKSSCYQFLQFFKCLHLFLIDRNIAFNKGGKTLFPE
ncbi:MAG: hypothetical protein IJ748_03625, partial [Bacteroidales bacterium]|nr:hypothetical protein [Bacteroidales bacterium]